MVEMAKPYIGDVDAPQGSLYEPQNTGERYSKAAGEMLPYAPVMGGAGAASVTGLASEGGGDLAALGLGKEYRPYGEIAGAFASGLRSGKVPKWKGGQTIDDAADVASSAYDALKGKQASAMTALRAQTKVKNALVNNGYKPRWHGKINKWLGQLDEVADDVTKKRAPVDFDDMKELRGGQLEDALRNGTNTERRLAKIAQESLDDVIETSREFGGLAGSAKSAYFQTKKLETLKGLRNAIENRQNYHNTSDFAKALKREMQKLETQINKPTSAGRRMKAQFTPEQRAVISKVAKGKDIPDVAKTLRNYSPSSGVYGPQSTAVGVIWSLMEGNPIPALVVGGSQAAGAATKGIANSVARNNWEKIEALGSGAQMTPWATRAASRAQQPLIRGAAAAHQSQWDQETAGPRRVNSLPPNAIPVP
jgi:hypothetical protein